MKTGSPACDKDDLKTLTEVDITTERTVHVKKVEAEAYIEDTVNIKNENDELINASHTKIDSCEAEKADHHVIYKNFEVQANDKTEDNIILDKMSASATSDIIIQKLQDCV